MTRPTSRPPQPAGLRRFVRQPAVSPPPVPLRGAQPAADCCELCSTAVPGEHGHVADLDTASLLCACRACYLLFTRAAANGRYLAVPDRYLSDPIRVMTAFDVDALEIPVGLAFFLRSSRTAEPERAGVPTAFYPSPAGATECQLDLVVWQQLASRFPLLAVPADDVEAVLISCDDDVVQYYVVPVDVCYELAGRMRQTWRGFDGGAQAREAITDFLSRVRRRARPFSPQAGAGPAAVTHG